MQAEAIIEKQKTEGRSERPAVLSSAGNTVIFVNNDSSLVGVPSPYQKKPKTPNAKTNTTAQRLSAPRPVQELKSMEQQVEFKEVHIKPVDLNILELRKKSTAKSPS